MKIGWLSVAVLAGLSVAAHAQITISSPSPPIYASVCDAKGLNCSISPMAGESDLKQAHEACGRHVDLATNCYMTNPPSCPESYRLAGCAEVEKAWRASSEPAAETKARKEAEAAQERDDQTIIDRYLKH